MSKSLSHEQNSANSTSNLPVNQYVYMKHELPLFAKIIPHTAKSLKISSDIRIWSSRKSSVVLILFCWQFFCSLSCIFANLNLWEHYLNLLIVFGCQKSFLVAVFVLTLLVLQSSTMSEQVSFSLGLLFFFVYHKVFNKNLRRDLPKLLLHD